MWRATPDLLAHHLDPVGFERLPHVRLIGEALARAVKGLGPKRIIITLPPQVGKSTLCSVWFVVWLLMLRPHRKIMSISATQDISLRNSRLARNIIEAHGDVIGLHLSEDSTAAGRWNTAEGGGLYATSINGLITSMTADGAVILDDLHKGFLEARSYEEREKVWGVWSTDILRAIGPETVVVVPATRQHHDDFTARVKEHDVDNQWMEIHIPAIADLSIVDPDPLGRATGEGMLGPDGKDLEFWEEQRRDSSRFGWATLYQGIPSPDDGEYIDPTWFQYLDAAPAAERRKMTCTSWDLTFGGDSQSSYVVGQKWVLTDEQTPKYLLVDEVRGQWSTPEMVRQIIAFAERHRDAQIHLLEDAAAAPSVIGYLREARFQGQVIKRPTAVKSQGGSRDGATAKERRVDAQTPLLEQGRVWLPGWLDPDTSFVAGFVAECTMFPAGANDDRVDAAMQALEWLRMIDDTRMSSTPGKVTDRRHKRRRRL